MNVDCELVKNIAKTARLELTQEELESIKNDLSEVLIAFSKIQELDTKGVSMSIQPVEIRNSFRDDEVKESLSENEALSQTNHKKDGFFMGPKSV